MTKESNTPTTRRVTRSASSAQKASAQKVADDASASTASVRTPFDRSGRPPRPTSGSSTKKKKAPSSASSSANKKQKNNENGKQKRGSKKGRGGHSHQPCEKAVLKMIRDALIANPKQQTICAPGRRISLKYYTPAESNEDFLGLDLEYCVYYNNLPSVPPDHPCDEALREEALARYPGNFEKDGIPLMLVQDMIYQHMSFAYDIADNKLWAIINAIGEDDMASKVPPPAATTTTATAESVMGLFDKTASILAGNANDIVALTAGQTVLTEGQALLNKKTGDLADGYKELCKKTSDLDDGQKQLKQGQNELKEVISSVKQQLKHVSDSAQKQYNDLTASVHFAAAQSMGGTRLFGNDFPGTVVSRVASPLASPMASPLLSPLTTVRESGANLNSELATLTQIASKRPDTLVERCESLIADSRQLSEAQQVEWKSWYSDNLGKGQHVSSLKDILKKATVYTLNNPWDLARLASFEALTDELQELDGVVIVGSRGVGDMPVCLMGTYTDIYETCPFLMTQVLPAFYGAKYEFVVETGDGGSLSVASGSPEAAMETLGAVLSLASKKDKQVFIQPDSTDPNTSQVKVEVHLPELNLQKRFEKLEFQSVKLPESTAAALSSSTRVLKLKSSEVYGECASTLFSNITSGRSGLEVLEIHNDVTIPTDKMLSLVLKKSSCVLSYQSGAWNQLPDNVVAAYKQQILAAMMLGNAIDLPLAIDPDDVLKGPLQAVEGDLISFLGSSDHPTIQRICEEGAVALPFKILPLKATLVERVKEWAKKIVRDEPGAKQQKNG